MKEQDTNTAEEETAPGPKDKYASGYISVAGPDGFWRAGRQWSRTATLVPLADLTDEQLEALEADPEISVQEARAPEADAEAEAGKAEKANKKK